jgi:hypothetical protein
MESSEITYLYNLHLLAFSVLTSDPVLDQLAVLDLRRVKNYFKDKGFKECAVMEQVEDVAVLQSKIEEIMT